MGEEISMSARLWTAGYDIFSPTVNVLNHYYVRRHYPKVNNSLDCLECLHPLLYLCISPIITYSITVAQN